ncbi:hypothetical protein SUGI_1022130 [Cryptomeria japonica]|nr:hypothetical protein SUGI_1022130 [Cryptomeria japonica]
MAQVSFPCNLNIARCPLSEINGRHCTIPQSFLHNSDRGKHALKTLCLSHSAVTDNLSVKQEFISEIRKDDAIDSLSITFYQCADRGGKEKRVQTLISEIKKMFKSMGDGDISPSAYDTAWVARVPALDGSDCPQFP